MRTLTRAEIAEIHREADFYDYDRRIQMQALCDMAEAWWDAQDRVEGISTKALLEPLDELRKAVRHAELLAANLENARDVLAELIED